MMYRLAFRQRFVPEARRSMAVVGPAVHISGDLDGHAARSTLRRLVAGLFDAWDDGDTETAASLFAFDTRPADPSGSTWTGAPNSVATALAAYRQWEPWSIHWLSNEQITVTDPEKCSGTWLWSSASNIDGGRTPVWSGGDLTVQAARSADGWRIEELTKTDRYRTPYQEGWLAVPIVEAPAYGALGGTSVGTGSTTGPPAGVVGTTMTLEDLSAEVELRTFMGEFIDDLEQGRSPSTMASRWTTDGSLTLVRGGERSVARRHHEIAILLDQEWSGLRSVMRMLFSESIAVHGLRAECRWRDLWVAVRDGAAVWLSHRYVVHAVRTANGWRFEHMEQRRELDCLYAGGWSPNDGANENGARS
jgi:hypothetical protein